ncbi:MAG: hypothetical protein JSR58_01330 [Verrucomicrobia bacterium]|nr:hypothetical protein [Verrucomicrobiota bacterium]
MKSTKKSIEQPVKASKRSFTLLEIVLALFILVTAAGFIGWNVKSLLDDHHFKDEVNGLYNDLQVAQLCALALHSEIKVNLSRDDEGWKARFLTDEMILEGWKKTERQLKHVVSIAGPPIIDITIGANGRLYSAKKNLFFSGKNRKYCITCADTFGIKLISGEDDGTEES